MERILVAEVWIDDKGRMMTHFNRSVEGDDAYHVLAIGFSHACARMCNVDAEKFWNAASEFKKKTKVTPHYHAAQ